jgi:hypothetical protein
MEMMTGFAPRMATDIFLCAPGTLLDLTERELVELPLRLRQVHDMTLEMTEMYDRHRYSAEFQNHHPVHIESDSYVMLKVPAFAKALAARRATGLATRLLLQWSGPHKVVRMIGTNNCEIVDRDDNKPYIVNVARLVPYRHFQPSCSAVDIAIRAALPQPAAAELESREEQQAAPLFKIVRLNGTKQADDKCSSPCTLSSFCSRCAPSTSSRTPSTAVCRHSLSS